MIKIKKKNNPFKVILVTYITLILLFAVLFMMPFSKEKEISVTDAIFTSTSAMSITGLSTINIGEELTQIGKMLLLLEIQIGGIGIMVIIATLFLVLRGKMSVSQQNLLTKDTNQENRTSLKKLTIFITLYALIIEFMGAFYFYIVLKSKGYEEGLIFKSIFHAVSSFTNVGFNVFQNGLVTYKSDNGFLLITSMLIILGAIGFPSVMELLTRRKRKLTLYTKVNLIMHGTLMLFGTIAVLLLEFKNSLEGIDIFEKITTAIFLSATTRSGGFETFPVSELTQTTILIFLILMFIGGSASSSSGGIRVTTFFVVVASSWSKLKGKKEVIVFRKTLFSEDIQKAHTIFTTFIGIFLVSTILMSAIESKEMLLIAFEVMSALTTTGLSLGITEDLTTFSKYYLCLLMIIGRVGLVILMYSFVKEDKTKIRYKREHIIVG